MAERVADACIDRGLGSEHDQAEPFALGKIHQPHHVRRADRDVASHAAGAAVAGRAVDALDQVRLDAFPDQGMLARARTDDEDFHWSMARAAAVTTSCASPQSTTSRFDSPRMRQ